MVPEGWYLDPEDDARLRWWDGARWTEARRAHHTSEPFSREPDGSQDPAPPTAPRVVPPEAFNAPAGAALAALANGQPKPARRISTRLLRIAILTALASIGFAVALPNLDAEGGIVYRLEDRTELNPLGGQVLLRVSGEAAVLTRTALAERRDRALTPIRSGRWTLNEPLRIIIDAPDRNDADLDVEVDLRVAGATFLNEGWNVVIDVVVTDTQINVRVTQPTTRGVLLERTDAFVTALRRTTGTQPSEAREPDASPPNLIGGLDPDAEPALRTITLVAGFPDDPQTFEVLAGGSADTSGLPASCRSAAIGARPDVRLNYAAGGLPLAISAFSDSADLMLVIMGPDEQFTCDDDSNGLNPGIEYQSPLSGTYNIWVGVFDSGMARGTLAISELGLTFP